MPGLSRKESERVIAHVQRQGVRVTPVKKGVLLRLPDGGTTVMHFTVSDHRGPDKLRARLKQAGVSWPTDPGKHTQKVKPSKLTVSRGMTAWHALGEPETVTTKEFAVAMGLAPDSESARRFLNWAGFVMLGSTSGARWKLVEPRPELATPAHVEPVLEPEPSAPVVDIRPPREGTASDRLREQVRAALGVLGWPERLKANEVYPLMTPVGTAADRVGDVMPAMGYHRVGHARGAAWVKNPPVASVPDLEPESVPEAEPESAPEAQPEPELVVAELVPDEPAAPELAVQTAGAGREFIDTVDSWAAWDGLPADMTVAQVRGMLEALGLRAELRVWRG